MPSGAPCDRRTCRRCGRSRAPRRRTATASRRSSMAVVEERAVPDEDEERSTTAAGAHDDVHHQEASLAADVPPGRRRHRRAAVARLDGAGAQTPLGQTAAAPQNAVRVPSTSRTARRWTSGRRPPRAPASTFTEILKPLEPFRERINVVSGLAHPYVAGAGGGDVSAGANHTRAAAVFLTRRRCRSAARRRTSASRSTRSPRSTSARTRRCRRWSCRSRKPCSAAKRRSAAPTATRSRGRSPTAPLPMQNNPQLVFEKLFGDGSTDAERRARRQESRSLLDSVMGAGRVAAEGSAGRRSPAPDAVPRRRARDRATDSARRSGSAATDLDAAGRADRRAGDVRRSTSSCCSICRCIALAGGHHARLDADVRARAEQRRVSRRAASATRSTTCRITRTTATNMDRFAHAQPYHVTKFAYFLEQAEGDAGRRRHAARSLAGAVRQLAERRQSAQLQSAADRARRRRVGAAARADAICVFPKDTHMSNLLLAMLDKLGVPTEKFGDSTGAVTI